jgi:integrase
LVCDGSDLASALDVGRRPAARWVQGLRFHDLRHTVLTELAEMGVADHVLESISSHLSRRMLAHF